MRPDRTKSPRWRAAMLGSARVSKMRCASANIASSTNASCAPRSHLSRCHSSPTKDLLRSTRVTESGDHRRRPGPGSPDLLRPWPIALVPFCSSTYSLKMRLTVPAVVGSSSMRPLSSTRSPKPTRLFSGMPREILDPARLGGPGNAPLRHHHLHARHSNLGCRWRSSRATPTVAFSRGVGLDTITEALSQCIRRSDHLVGATPRQSTERRFRPGALLGRQRPLRSEPPSTRDPQSRAGIPPNRVDPAFTPRRRRPASSAVHSPRHARTPHRPEVGRPLHPFVRNADVETSSEGDERRGAGSTPARGRARRPGARTGARWVLPTPTNRCHVHRVHSGGWNHRELHTRTGRRRIHPRPAKRDPWARFKPRRRGPTNRRTPHAPRRQHPPRPAPTGLPVPARTPNPTGPSPPGPLLVTKNLSPTRVTCDWRIRSAPVSCVLVGGMTLAVPGSTGFVALAQRTVVGISSM